MYVSEWLTWSRRELWRDAKQKLRVVLDGARLRWSEQNRKWSLAGVHVLRRCSKDAKSVGGKYVGSSQATEMVRMAGPVERWVGGVWSCPPMCTKDTKRRLGVRDSRLVTRDSRRATVQGRPELTRLCALGLNALNAAAWTLDGDHTRASGERLTNQHRAGRCLCRLLRDSRDVCSHVCVCVLPCHRPVIGH